MSPLWMFSIFPIFGFFILIRFLLLKKDGAFFEKTLVPYTKFLYEDGNYYFFKISKRSSSSYSNLRCYKKTMGLYKQVGNEELVDSKLKTERIKTEIKQILEPYTAKFEGSNWDGFVGDIPDHIKREGRFKQLLDKEVKNEGEETRS
jgi:hypothetical protein